MGTQLRASSASNGHRDSGSSKQKPSADDTAAAWRSGVGATSLPALCLPIAVLTDSYKASHFLQYPESRKMVAVSSWASCSACCE